MKWVTFNHSTGVARCEICAPSSELADCNSKVVNGFRTSFKLETIEKHDKSFQHLKCIEANNVLSTPLAACMKKSDQKMLRSYEACFNIPYYIAKHNKPYTGTGGLVALVDKLGVGSEYSNDMRCA
jgi:hypothetical protein